MTDSALPPASPHGMDRPALLAALRARCARLGPDRRLAGPSLPLCAPIDQGLPGGGLARAALHEVLAADDAGAGFCALLLARAREGGEGSLVWIAADPAARPPGLAHFGLAPAGLVLVRAACPEDGLWAMEEALRCPGIAGAVLALNRPDPDPAAARRLQLAAEAGGGLGLLLHPDADAEDPGGALTRWRVSSLAGTGSSAHTLGDPRWQLDLLRCRGGRPGRYPVVWRAAAERLELDGGDENADPPTPAAPPRPRRRR